MSLYTSRDGRRLPAPAFPGWIDYGEWCRTRGGDVIVDPCSDDHNTPETGLVPSQIGEMFIELPEYTEHLCLYRRRPHHASLMRMTTMRMVMPRLSAPSVLPLRRSP